MARAGGGLGARGSLVLLGLCSWLGARAEAPGPVRNLTVVTQNTSSITLAWERPDGPDNLNYSYWVQCTGAGRNDTQNTTTDTSITVDRLEPGSLYEFQIWVEKNGVNSSREARPTATAPNPVRNLTVVTQNTSSIILAWEAPQDLNTSNYIYWIQCIGNYKNENQSTRDTSVTVGELEPGSLYEFQIWAEKNGVNSSQEARHVATAPCTVRNLSLEHRTNNSITLRWMVPEDPDTGGYTYWVEHAGSDGRPEPQNTTNTSVTAKGLESGTSYAFSVWAVKHGVPGSRKNLNIATVPNPVTGLHVRDQTNSSIALGWTAPQGAGHPPYTYLVSWAREGIASPGTLSTPNTSFILEKLEPGSLYNLTVWASRNDVVSDTSTLMATTAPSEVTDLQNKTQTNHSVTLQWMAPADPYSQLYRYRVQWASGGHPQLVPKERGPQGERFNLSADWTTETWYKVEALEPGTLYNFSVWAERNNVASSTRSHHASTAPNAVTITSCVSASGGYGVILTWSCPSGGYEVFELEVGGQRDSPDRSSCGRGVSVSGLGPAESYQATIITVWDGMRAPSAPVTCHTESTGVIVGAIMGVLLLLLLVGLLIFFLKKRNKKRQEKAVPKDMVFSFPGDILAKDFAEHVRKNEKDSNCGFAEEYQQLALESHDQPQIIASALENMTKNRYRNVLPYDWSRVPLKPIPGEPGSDYINASFIPGLWSPQEFIATQGPLPQTVGDFWRLVWEQQSCTLVMLTNCVESGRVKCEHYWPLDTQPCTHGHLRVTLVSEKVTENWTVRDLQLLQVEEQKTLSVRQFHYLAWPDHGAPHSPEPLLAFWKELRQWLDQVVEGGPPIVHCSAGVGRTGTLIALDVLLRQLQSEGLVGPFDFVRKMRGSRPLMVQTETQYVFLHQCLLRFLEQSASALVEKEAIYENVANLIYENADAIRAHKLEV
ncbi:receptor-type tyrosine-protein phosphatase H [Carlito syrichta]|uniref:Receptor-type tyrosine-protein phosphatase H n=1 Tax=Carlito syrichta TaxID=1868482 RepID=A0A1U7UBM0_CARSF|nr:receptor-type tyrosine-protein phosphatase H [Carlito syrichta]